MTKFRDPVCDHMNEDRTDAVKALAEDAFEAELDSAVMIRIDR